MSTGTTLGAVDLFDQLARNRFGFFEKIHSVADIMTREVQTLTLDDTYQDAVNLFRRGRFRHAPVVEEGHVVGVVSDRDLLRHCAPLLGTAAEGDSDHRALRTTVSEFLTRAPVAVAADSSPDAALNLMLERHIDSVLVHDEQKAIQGIVTPRDFMRMVLLFHRVCTGTKDLVRFRLVDLDMSRGLPLDLIFSRGARSVRDVMTKEVTSLKKGESVETAMELMQSLRIRHLPVVDDANRVIGVVSDRDILRFLPLPVPRPRPQQSLEGFREKLFATSDRRSLGESVGVLMARAPVTIKPDTLLVDAINVMLEQGVSGLPVAESAEDQLCGIFTTTDVLRVFRVMIQIGSIVNSTKAA